MAELIRGTTPSGFNFELDPDVLDDYDLFEDLGEVENNPMLAPSILRRVLGTEQKSKLVDHCRKEDGIARIADVSAEMSAIFASVNKIKNS